MDMNICVSLYSVSNDMLTFLFHFQVLCGGLGIYADNILCLDLCAVPKNIARQVIGSTVPHPVLCSVQKDSVREWECSSIAMQQDGSLAE